MRALLATCAVLLSSFAACANPERRGPVPLESSIAPPLLAAESSADEFEPKPPVPKKWDWIKLKSGEWLKGEIKSMRNDSLEFDSKELDEQTFDFEKIIEIRSGRSNTVVFEGKEYYTGRISIRGEAVTIQGIPQIFERSKLVSIVPGDAKERSLWSGKLSLGIAVRSGNTNQTDLTAYATVRRRGPYSRLEMTFNGAFGKVEGTETINNHRLAGNWDVFLSRHWYVRAVGFDLYRDVFQNIKYRATPYAGVGYFVVRTPKLEWDIFGGFGWRFEEVLSIEGGGDPRSDTGTLSIGTHSEWDITSSVEWTTDLNVQVGIPDTQDTNVNFFTQLSVDLIGDLDLDVGLTWNRIGQPVSGAGGTEPVPDDLRLSVGLGWDF